MGLDARICARARSVSAEQALVQQRGLARAVDKGRMPPRPGLHLPSRCGRGGSVAVPRAHDVLLCSGCVPPERAFPTAHPPTLLHCALCVAQPEGTSSVAVAAPCRCAHTCTSNCMRPQWRASRTWTMRYSQLRGCGRVQLSTHCAALRASVVAPCPSTVSSASAAAAGLVRCLAPGQ